MANKITNLEIGKKYNIWQYGEYSNFETIGTITHIDPDAIVSVSDRQGGYYISRGLVLFSYQCEEGEWEGESSIEEALADWTTL